MFEHAFHVPGGEVLGDAIVSLRQPYPGKKINFTILGQEKYYESGSGDDSDTVIKKDFLS